MTVKGTWSELIPLHLRHGVGEGDGSLLLLHEVREIPILPLPDTVLNVLSLGRTSLTSLMLYPNSADIQWCLHRKGIGGPVLEGLPLPLLDGGNIPLYTLFCLPGRHFINLRTFRKV